MHCVSDFSIYCFCLSKQRVQDNTLIIFCTFTLDDIRNTVGCSVTKWRSHSELLDGELQAIDCNLQHLSEVTDFLSIINVIKFPIILWYFGFNVKFTKSVLSLFSFDIKSIIVLLVSSVNSPYSCHVERKIRLRQQMKNAKNTKTTARESIKQ